MEMIRKIVIAAAMIAAGVCIYLGVSHYASTSQVDNVAIQKHCKYGKSSPGVCKPKPLSKKTKNILIGVGTAGSVTAGTAIGNGIKDNDWQDVDAVKSFS